MPCKLCGGELEKGRAQQCEDTGDVFCDEQCANIDWQTPAERIEAIPRFRGRRVRGLTNWKRTWGDLFDKMFEFADLSHHTWNLIRSKGNENMEDWAEALKRIGNAADKLNRAVDAFKSMLSVSGAKDAGDDVETQVRNIAWAMIRYVREVTSGPAQTNVIVNPTHLVGLVRAILGSGVFGEGLRAELNSYWDGENPEKSLPDRFKTYIDSRVTGDTPAGWPGYQVFRAKTISIAEQLGVEIDEEFRQQQERVKKAKKEGKQDVRKHQQRKRREPDVVTPEDIDVPEAAEPPQTPPPGGLSPPPPGVPPPPPLPPGKTVNFVVTEPIWLPEDWYAVFHPDIRAYYFYNPVVNVKSWAHPAPNVAHVERGNDGYLCSPKWRSLSQVSPNIGVALRTETNLAMGLVSNIYKYRWKELITAYAKKFPSRAAEIYANGEDPQVSHSKELTMATDKFVTFLLDSFDKRADVSERNRERLKALFEKLNQIFYQQVSHVQFEEGEDMLKERSKEYLETAVVIEVIIFETFRRTDVELTKAYADSNRLEVRVVKKIFDHKHTRITRRQHDRAKQILIEQFIVPLFAWLGQQPTE